MSNIIEISNRYGIKVIEDAAHSLPTVYNSLENKELSNKKIGSFGDIACFSFYANKTITTGEGGMLVTNDDSIAKRVKVMRLHGIDRDVFGRYSSDRPSWYYEVIEPGYKYNMTDIAAALGVNQLKKCDEFQRKRSDIARYYLKNLEGIDGLILPKIKCEHKDHAWHLFVVLVEPTQENGMMTRDEFISRLSELGIGTSVHYIPLHMQPYYKKRFNLKVEDFPNSTWIYERCVSLPIYQGMLDHEVEYVVNCIKKVLKK